MPAQKNIDLYYIGGFPGNTGEQFINVRGSAFVVPPPGQYVRLVAHVANEVLKRYPNQFTRDHKLATRAAGIPDIYRPPSPSNLSVKDLEALLEVARLREEIPSSRTKEAKESGVEFQTKEEVQSTLDSMRVEEDEEDVEDPQPVRMTAAQKREAARRAREEQGVVLDTNEISDDAGDGQ